MVNTAVQAIQFIGLFWIALFALQAGVWTYWSLNLAVGVVGIVIGVVLFLYAGRRTFRLIGGANNG